MDEEEHFNELIKRIRSGDQDAARECVSLYEPEIRRAARLRLTDPQLRRLIDSNDICQSVFGRFFENASNGSFDLQSPEQLLSLLLTMTRNKVIDKHRHQTAQRRHRPATHTGPAPITDPNQFADETSGPRSVAAARELLSEVRSRLMPNELIVADRRNAGESWDEIAAALNESADTLRKRFTRALDRVRAEFEASANPTDG